ncbi:amino acid ABC transporter membrane protein 1, PAAT family [Gemmobacter megaterium]|uniref:Amino acid ABC transporter membrane protein 1, PAAT family n=1 Tax=Gemmobacter megaterium TaxID=1086013 RepID=A0A1N7N9R4_9RHOB|nr:amino acid ABC transporter permease [Gemmobacter megaterium]GGE13782.1 ABC transporter permease [Gemmobacter megaterium]SIS94998.1 amino acid ABC transporter membrane protein 1, PAAT family [Gemmobacter megaterium]
MPYEWDFLAVLAQWPLLLSGLLGTIKIAVIAIAAGVIVGGLVAAMRLSRLWPVRLLGTIYVDFYRNTPGILHFFWFYYALPVLSNVSLGPLEAAALALATQSGAFYAEVFRGGIGSIRKGQWEGAKALGMIRGQALRRVILPQAARRMIAPFTERSFEIIKTTSLASTLSYGELLYQGMMVASITFRPLETYTLLALIYFALLFSLSALAKWGESRLQAY